MINYLDLKKVNSRYDSDIKAAIDSVLSRGWYLKGQAVEAFENEFAKYTGRAFCVSCANGLDALTLMLRAYIETGQIAEGDEIIVPANTYIATILSITANRLTPILVEPDINTLQIDDSLIEQAITPRTRAILIVNLYGRDAFTQHIAEICRHHKLFLFEDCAQSHGIPPHGNAQAHSFYPTKNLGALGDAGAVTTDDKQIADIVRAMANYGSSRKYVFDYKGRNSRMDEIQAAVLSVKLKHLDEENRRRREIARYYFSNINNPLVTLPYHRSTEDNVFHIFPTLSPERDKLQAYLMEKGIQTDIHYPIPPHKQQCYSEWNNISLPITEEIHRCELSLPIAPYHSDEEVNTIVNTINNWTH
ncbi:MAG: DegT/DnrJ/EryC1/StrS family aminotransferase [Prevotella sp.]|nr:DegT/DnrJ/EryC1/StrS family aminotransferase [Prevotella sp.]